MKHSCCCCSLCLLRRQRSSSIVRLHFTVDTEPSDPLLFYQENFHPHIPLTHMRHKENSWGIKKNSGHAVTPRFDELPHLCESEKILISGLHLCLHSFCSINGLSQSLVTVVMCSTRHSSTPVCHSDQSRQAGPTRGTQHSKQQGSFFYSKGPWTWGPETLPYQEAWGWLEKPKDELRHRKFLSPRNSTPVQKYV